MANADFYEGVSENTAAVLKRMQVYVDLALKNGDVAYQDKPGEITIKVRIKK